MTIYRRVSIRLSWLVAVTALALAGAVLPQRRHCQAAQAQGQGTITPNYKDADLSQIIEAVSAGHGQEFHRRSARARAGDDAVVDADVAGRVLRGLPVDPAGAWLRRRARGRCRSRSFRTRTRASCRANDLPSRVSSTSDEIVTQVIAVRNVSAAQLVPILRPLIPQYGHLAAYPASNMLIISDRAANVNRMMRIIQRIDQTGDEADRRHADGARQRHRGRAHRQRAVTGGAARRRRGRPDA